MNDALHSGAEGAGYGPNGSTPSEPSLAVDFEGASTVEMTPPGGEYDFTILRFTHTRSKSVDEQTGVVSKATYVDSQLQLDTEPARGRQVYDKLLTTFVDGVTVVGTSQAAAKGWTMANTALGIIQALGLPSNTLRTMGPISDVIGKQLRGKFAVKKDRRSGENALRLVKVVGKATGQGFTPGVAAQRPATESF